MVGARKATGAGTGGAGAVRDTRERTESASESLNRGGDGGTSTAALGGNTCGAGVSSRAAPPAAPSAEAVVGMWNVAKRLARPYTTLVGWMRARSSRSLPPADSRSLMCSRAARRTTVPAGSRPAVLTAGTVNWAAAPSKKKLQHTRHSAPDTVEEEKKYQQTPLRTPVRTT